MRPDQPQMCVTIRQLCVERPENTLLQSRIDLFNNIPFFPFSTMTWGPFLSVNHFSHFLGEGGLSITSFFVQKLAFSWVYMLREVLSDGEGTKAVMIGS